MQLKSHLECAICLDIFKDPRRLPCGHSFCADCLDKLVERRESFDCPICKEKHTKPRNGFVADFKSNQLLDVLNEVFDDFKLKFTILLIWSNELKWAYLLILSLFAKLFKVFAENNC